MSNLIRYIIQEDPEKQMKKNDFDYAKYPTWAPVQKQSQEDKYKGYKFSSKNLLENSFNSLTSNKSSQSKDEGSVMSGISNIFNNIKSDEKSSSNASLPQSVAKTAAEESSKISTVLSPKSIGNDAASYKIAQNNKENMVNDANIPSGKFSDKELTERMLPVIKDKEKPLDYIYIDTTWNKTTGAGANVDDWNTFNKVNWEINGRSATEEEKRASFDYFDKITSKGKQNVDEKGKLLEKNNNKADFYSNKSQLRISSNETDRLLRNHITEDIKYLQKEFPDFASYPPELQNVLLDIKFNTGNVSAENWPKLRKAISEKNLFGKEGILKNVHRKDVGEDRNLWAEQQIRNIKSW